MKTYRFFSILCLGFLLLCSVSILSAQQVDFISYLDERTANLPQEARQRLDAIKAQPTAISARLIKFRNITTLSSQLSLRIPIPGLGQLVATATNIERPEASKVFWSGVLQDNKNRLSFAVVDGDVTGMIHTDRAVFSIEPLGAGHHALIALDQSKFGPDDPPDAYSQTQPIQHQDEKNLETQSSKPSSEASITSTSVIDVLVAYTQAVANATGNINSLVAACIQSTNETLTNSNVNAQVALVHSVQVTYTESGSTNTDVNRLRGTSDGYMDNVHSLRNQYGADVVVLLIDYANNAVGQAYDIQVGASDAFCVSVDNAAVGNYTFAHEIGHLVGGRHDNDPSGTYQHGYRYASAYWRTVMAIPLQTNDPVLRIPYWSNPNKTYGGVAMGTTTTHDNTRKWNERASTVAGFKSAAPSVTITGPSSISPGVEGTWSANVSGGSGTITYQWSVRYDGSSTFTNLGTSQNQSLTFPDDCTINDLKVDVVRGGQSAQDLQTVIVSSGPIFCKRAAEDAEELAQIPDKFDLHQNFPNPFNPETEIRFDLPEEAHVQVIIFDLLGREVRTLVDKNAAAGYHSVVWDGRDNSGQAVASGVYLYRMSAGNFREVKKLTLVR